MEASKQSISSRPLITNDERDSLIVDLEQVILDFLNARKIWTGGYVPRQIEAAARLATEGIRTKE